MGTKITPAATDVLASRVAVLVTIEFEDGITARVLFSDEHSLALFWREGWRVLSCDMPMWHTAPHGPDVMAARLAQWCKEAGRSNLNNLTVVWSC